LGTGTLSGPKVPLASFKMPPMTTNIESPSYAHSLTRDSRFFHIPLLKAGTCGLILDK